jgi:hypothetical protein
MTKEQVNECVKKQFKDVLKVLHNTQGKIDWLAEHVYNLSLRFVASSISSFKIFRLENIYEDV